MKEIYWLTGLPCSGKTTIAKELSNKINAEMLDGDDIRQFMHNKDFSYAGRKKHMFSVAELAKRFAKHTNVVVSLVSPIKEVRDEIKKRHPEINFIYVDCPVEVCEQRDVKGMYAKARAGEIKHFTGIDAPYDISEEYFSVDTVKQTVEESAQSIIDKFSTKDVYSLFIGRWQCLPPHEGHLKLFDTVRQEGKKICIAVRDTDVDEKNPYSASERVASIKRVVPDAEIIVIPDIDAVCYGRGVGYDIREIVLDETTQAISATERRKNVTS